MIGNFDADSISLCETHLEANTTINLECYNTYVENRLLRNKLNRTFGGIQVLAKSKFGMEVIAIDSPQFALSDSCLAGAHTSVNAV